MGYRLPITLTFVLAAATAFAQGTTTAVATSHAPVYVAPDASRTPLRTAARGTVFTVVAEEGDWTKVQFKDPQWGVRVGYVETRLLRIARPELAPMDLSVGAPDTAPVPRPAAGVDGTPAPSPRKAPVPAAAFERAFVDVNFGVAGAREKSFTWQATDPLFSETRTFRMSYENPTGASFDFGGGVMFTPKIGIGVSFAGAAHQSPVDMFASVPHPFAFNAHATDTEESDQEFPAADFD